jgi:predicted dehydrogenase
MEKLKVGVIGVGGMGSIHARIYSEMPDVELYAVADTDEKRRREVGQRLGASKIFSNYQDLLALEEINMVDICTPDELHLGPVVDALEAKKHIFLEKPLATDLEEARKIVDESQKRDLKFMVGYLLRFDPRYINVKNAIEAGDLGEIINIISHRNSPYTQGPARYKAGTSITMHIAVHDLDLIYWFMKSHPLNISAEFSSKKLVLKNMQDAVSALIKFENGAFASVNYSWVLPEKFPTLLDARMEVVGTKGAAYIGIYHQEGVMLVTEEGIKTPDLLLSPEVNGKIKGALYEELRTFVDCVKEDKPTPIPPEEAFESVKMANEIINSLQKK